jgi:hypothetical protein
LENGAGPYLTIWNGALWGVVRRLFGMGRVVVEGIVLYGKFFEGGAK